MDAFAEAARGYGLAKELVAAASAAEMVMLDSEFCMRLWSCGAPPPGTTPPGTTPPPPPPPPGPLGAAALAVAEVDMGASPPPSEEARGCCALASVAAPEGPNSMSFYLIM